MSPLARRVMEMVHGREHGTYERWFQAIVDATLNEAARHFVQFGTDPFTAVAVHCEILELKSQEQEPCE